MAPSTRDTTQSNAIAAGFLTALIAAGMLVYAALYTKPAWDFAQAEPRYHEVERGRLGTVVELDALTQALRASPSRADLSRAAFVQMLTAQQLGLSSLRAVGRLSSARRDLRFGLTATPTDAFAWMRLAVTEIHLNHPRDAAAALGLAISVAPQERKLVPLEFDLAIILWPQLTGQEKKMIEQRINWARRWADLKQGVEGNSAVALRQHLKDESSDP